MTVTQWPGPLAGRKGTELVDGAARPRAARAVSVRTLAELDDCFHCGAARWEPRLHANGDPYLRCGGCGRTTHMPLWLEQRLPLRRLPRDVAGVAT